MAGGRGRGRDLSNQWRRRVEAAGGAGGGGPPCSGVCSKFGLWLGGNFSQRLPNKVFAEKKKLN